eukprot:7203045-Pyramimonas_sp.AAC.1
MEFEAMSQEQQDLFFRLNANVGPNDIHGADASDDDVDVLDVAAGARVDAPPAGETGGYSLEQLSRQVLPFDVGDDVWPVAGERLRAHAEELARKFGMAEWRGGLCRIGEARRAELRQDMCISDDPRLRPPLRVRLPCWEVHPGLCRIDDAPHFQVAMALARKMLSILHAGVDMGCFVGFTSCAYHSEPYCLGLRRFRLPPLLVFAKCVFSTDADDELFDDDVYIDLRTHRGELQFETSYSIARPGRVRVHVSAVDVAS